MKTFLSTTLLLLFMHSAVSAQQTEQLTTANSDCSGAIHVIDTVFGPTSAPTGPGKEMEISGDRKSLYSFHKEHHTVWYTFVAPGNGTLELTVEPLSMDDDYDFLLFRKKGVNFCKQIKAGVAKPLRSNISRNDKRIQSKTGLREGDYPAFVNEGPGEDFSKAVEVQKGDTFLLVLDNVYPKGSGHRLLLHWDVEKPKPTKKEVIKNQKQVIITVTDKNSGKLLNADLSISYEGNSKPLIEQKNISQLVQKLKPGTEYNLTVNADKYFREIMIFSTNTKDSIVHVAVPLTKIEKGTKLTLKNMHFYSGSASFLRESYETLRNLLEIMKENPSLKIAIHGHVNQPYQWKRRSSEEYLQTLSERRAEAVKRYLTRRGISEDRMITEGFSNREMIYPYAETEEEQSANRRVEIKVLDI